MTLLSKPGGILLSQALTEESCAAVATEPLKHPLFYSCRQSSCHNYLRLWWRRCSPAIESTSGKNLHTGEDEQQVSEHLPRDLGDEHSGPSHPTVVLGDVGQARCRLPMVLSSAIPLDNPVCCSLSILLTCL